MRGGWLALGAVPFLVYACVGDSSEPLPDGGIDATTNDVVTNDVVATDAAADAQDAADAAATCSVTTAFGNKVTLAIGTTGVNVPGDTQSSFYASPDQLLAYLTRTVPDSGLGKDIWSVSRTTKAAVWGNTARADILNSEGGIDDFDPVLSNDETEIFFARSVGQNFAVVWTTLVGDAGPGVPAKVGATVNGLGDRVEPTWLNPSSQHLYLNVANVDAGLSYDIYRADRAGPGDGFASTFEATVNGPNNDKNAVLTSDDLAMYFASDRPGGDGGYDVYIATRASTSDDFGTPTPVTELNTSGDELPVWISSNGCLIVLTDNNTLFSYDRTPQ